MPLRPLPRAGILALVGMALLPVAAAAAPGCTLPRSEQPKVTLKVVPTEKPPVDRSLGVLELTRKARDLGNRHAGRGRVLGLTTSEFRFGVPRLRATPVRTGDGRVCLRTEEIVVELQAAQKVYVVKAQGATPCWDAAILEHEMQHVSFNNDAVRRTSELLEPRLRELAREGSRTAKDADQAGKAMAAAIQELVRKASAEALAEAAKRHASIDTADAYTQVKRRCGL